MLGEPELSQRQPEWDRQLESIDNQELEIHQSQLRLMRDQTAVFIRDLEALRKEVLALRSVRGDVQSIDTSLKELRETVTMEGAKREASRTRFEQRLCSELEQVLGVQLHTSLEADRDPLSPELVAQECAVEPSHGSILARLGQLEGDARGGLGSEKLGRFHGDLQELREVVGGEKLARETHQRAFDESVQAVQSSNASLSERFADLERSLAETAEMRRKEITSLQDKLDAHRASGTERLDHVETALREASAKLTAELEELRGSKVRQEAEAARHARESEISGALQQRRVEELERALQNELVTVRARLEKACVPERMDYLECMMERTCDKHERMLEKTREDVERISLAIESGDGTLRAPERDLMERLHESWGSAVRKQGEDVEVLRAEQSALAQELQAAKASLGGKLADAKAATELCVTATKEQIQHLEGLLTSSAEKHAVEMTNLRDSDTRRATDFATLRAAVLERFADITRTLTVSGFLREELAAVRGEFKLQGMRLGQLAQAHDNLAGQSPALQALCASLRARLESLEHACGERADRQAGDLRTTSDGLARLREELARDHGAMEMLQGRLEACERSTASIEDQQETIDGLNDELASHEAELGCLTARFDCVQRLVGSAAETSAKALETAHGGMEKLRARLMKIEGERRAVDSLRAEFADDQADLDTRLASLEGRVDSLGRRLGEAGGERAKELEAALNVRLASLEGRIDGYGRRLTEVGGERSRELEAALDSRLAPLELLIEDLRRKTVPEGSEDSHHLEARIEFLEDMLVKSKEAYGGDIESLKASLEVHAGELEAIKEASAYHESIVDRLEGLDQAFGETSIRHDDCMADAQAKLEELCSRLAACEEHKEYSTTLGEPDLVNHSLSMDTTAFDSFCESFKERHVRELEGMRAASRQQAARLDSLEASLRDADARHADGLVASQAQLEQLRSRAAAAERQSATLAELQRAQGAFARDREDWEARHAERVDELEERMGHAAEKQERLLDAVHARIEKFGSRVSVCERQGGELRCAQSLHSDLKAQLESQLAALRRRVDCLGESLGEGFSRRVWELEIAQEPTSGESSVRHPTVEDRLRELETGLGEANGRQGRQLEAVKAQLREVQQRSSQEREDREAWQESFQERTGAEKTARDTQLALVDNRLKSFEDALGKSAERLHRQVEEVQTQQNSLAQRMGPLEQRLGPLEERLGELSALCQESAQDRAAQAKLEESIAQQLQEEKRARENQLAWERKAREGQGRLMEDVQTKLDQLEHSLAEARENQLAWERKARQGQGRLIEDLQSKLDQLEHSRVEDRVGNGAVRERMGQLEQRLGELATQVAEEPRAHGSELSQRVDRVDSKLTELIDLCDQFSVERAKWAQLDSTIIQQLQDERKAREAQGGELKAELSLEQRAREAHEHLTQEQFAQDRAARERFQDRLQDILAREGEVRERRLEGYEAALQHEAQARETCAKELREMLTKERMVREQHHAKWSELLCELSARHEREGEDAGERSSALGERVQAMQRSLTVCDSLMREEIQVRCKETKRLWEAINFRSQSEAKQAQPDDKEAIQDSDAEVTDSYVPFPCQPLTSFLRLGGQGLAESERRRRIRLFSPSSRSASPRQRRR